MKMSLDATDLRSKTIANNIANVNTPNFKRSDVEFEKVLQGYINGGKLSGTTTHEEHISIGVRSIKDVEHKVVKSGNYSTRRDKNNVDIDVEMAELAKNTIAYNTLSTQLNNHFSRLRIAINEGKR